MSLENLLDPFPWSKYSKKLVDKILHPRGMGAFDQASCVGKNVRLVVGVDGCLEDGNIVQLYWLVDKENGQILEAKYQVFGQTALIGAAEVITEMVVGKNYDQARRISADLVDRQVRDHPDRPSFPHETAPHLNLVLGAVEEGADQCLDLPLPTSYEAPPIPLGGSLGEASHYPGWELLDTQKKLTVLEEVMDREIRPYIALDGGGVEVINLIGDEVIIKYQGTCTSCFSSVGATLAYIQQVIQTRVYPSLKVTPSL